MKRNIAREIFMPLITAAIWGTAFVFQKLCAEHLPPFTVNALRGFIAVLVLTPVALLFDAAKKRRGEWQPLNWRKWLLGSFCCGAMLSLGVNLQQAGLAVASAGKAGFITAFYVVLVPIFGRVIGQKVRSRIWLCVGLMALGLWLLCLKAGESFSLAPTDALLILCAAGFAVQVLFVDHFVQHVDGVKLSIGQFLVSGILSGILALLFETPTWTGFTASLWPLLYISVMSSGVAYTLQILAQKDTNPTIVCLLLGLESVFSVVGGALILGDRMTVREYLGCAVMFTAVVLAQLPGREAPVNSEE
ncbi:MAG: DMT family transporter [Oscillospiraceae bacterium]|nr:DMT family transporter [Oscillospiraceae bacterium]